MGFTKKEREYIKALKESYKARGGKIIVGKTQIKFVKGGKVVRTEPLSFITQMAKAAS